MNDSQSASNKSSLRRTFAAALPAAACRDKLTEFCTQAAAATGGRPMPAQNLHITLRFYGDSDPDQIAGQLQRVSQAGKTIERFLVSVARLRAMPRRHPRLLWLELVPDPHLLRLHQLQFAKGEEQERRFLPHITAVRAISSQPVKLPGCSLNKIGPIEAESIALIQSHLQPDGSQYEIIERFKLANAPPAKRIGNRNQFQDGN